MGHPAEEKNLPDAPPAAWLDLIAPALPGADLRDCATDLAGRLTRVLGEVC